MGEITIHLPSELEASLEDLVAKGAYRDKHEAVIALIRLGIAAMKKKREAVYAPEYPPVTPFKPPEKWPDHYEFR